MFCFAQGDDESTLTVQTKAASVVPLAVFSPKGYQKESAAMAVILPLPFFPQPLYNMEAEAFGTISVQVQVWYLV